MRQSEAVQPCDTGQPVRYRSVAEWQRDLAVSHFKLYQFAQKAGDEAMMQAELRACFLVLDGMKQRGMHLDPPSANLHGQLAGMFGAG